VVVSFLIGNATARFFFINCLQSEELLQNKLKRISIGGHLVERYDGMPASTELRISARLIWGLKNVATVGLVKVEMGDKEATAPLSDRYSAHSGFCDSWQRPYTESVANDVDWTEIAFSTSCLERVVVLSSVGQIVERDILVKYQQLFLDFAEGNHEARNRTKTRRNSN
jgi:hypothetical protein